MKVGDKAKDFSLPDQDGRTHRLSEYRGRWVLLYFYPRDFTPGCTREARDFRDAWKEIRAAGLVVLGISRDSPERHRRFAEKEKLPFPLLSDPDARVHRLYGAWKEGPPARALRKSFLVDPTGRIAYVWEKVKPAGHAREVLEQLLKLQRR